MKQRIWLAISAVIAAISIAAAAIAIPQMASAGVSGSVGNGPMVFQSGTYTPTAGTNVNIASYAFHSSHWTRVGDVVHVEGAVDVLVGSNSGLPLTVVRISLPVASALSSQEDLWGNAVVDEDYVMTVAGIGTTTYTHAELYYYSKAANLTDMKRIYFDFSYKVK